MPKQKKVNSFMISDTNWVHIHRRKNRNDTESCVMLVNSSCTDWFDRDKDFDRLVKIYNTEPNTSNFMVIDDE